VGDINAPIGLTSSLLSNSFINDISQQTPLGQLVTYSSILQLQIDSSNSFYLYPLFQANVLNPPLDQPNYYSSGVGQLLNVNPDYSDEEYLVDGLFVFLKETVWNDMTTNKAKCIPQGLYPNMCLVAVDEFQGFPVFYMVDNKKAQLALEK